MQWKLPLLLCLVAAGVHLYLQHSHQLAKQEVGPAPRTCSIADEEAAVQRFAQSLTYKTVGNASTPDHINLGQHAQYTGFLDFLEASFPALHSSLTVEKVGVGGWSRLYTWQGSDSSLPPVIFISHYDVVPVAEGTEKNWTHGPFDGTVADGYVWGRGALDVKYGMMGLMEAVSRLLQEGFTPRRTLMFTWGHDEELAGTLGAAKVAELLQERGVQLDIVIDEGGAILGDGVKGLTDQPLAIIGTAEKVYTSIEVVVRGAGGHSSMPPPDGSDVASQLGRLITYISTHQPPVEVRAPVTDFIQALAPVAKPVLRPLLHHVHRWPLSWLLGRLLAVGREGGALVRTTLVATQLQAGVADNVLPITGSVTFNIRSHPHVPRKAITDYMEGAVKAAKVAAQSIRLTDSSFMGPQGTIAPSSGTHYTLLKQAIQEYWRHGEQGVTVAPFMLTGGTDSKHYAALSQHGILRFVPYKINKTEMGTVHSTNERASVDTYIRGVCTYQRIIELMATQ